MSLTKDMWMDEVERVGEDYSAGELTRDQAINRLFRLGIDRDEAETMLDEATA